MQYVDTPDDIFTWPSFLNTQFHALRSNDIKQKYVKNIVISMAVWMILSIEYRGQFDWLKAHISDIFYNFIDISRADFSHCHAS